MKFAAAEQRPPLLEMVTLDDRLADAARREGFAIVSQLVRRTVLRSVDQNSSAPLKVLYCSNWPQHYFIYVLFRLNT